MVRLLLAPGRLTALGLLLLAATARFLDPSTIEELRLRGFDLEEQLSPRQYVAPQVPVRIVEIDEASLRRFGQWPWPRTLVAKLIEGIAAAQPLALGIDILFAEPDRFSPDRLPAALPDLPEEISQALARMPPNESRLAAALRRVPTVLGLAPLPEADAAGGPVRLSLVRESGADARPFLKRYVGLLHSRPEISVAEKGRGALTGEPDADGIVRRIPLIVSSDGRLIAAFSVELLRVASSGAPVGIVTAGDGVQGVSVDELFVPTDRNGRAYPYFSPSLADRSVSAASVLDGSFDPASFRGGIVLLGATGLGLVDLKQTPTGLMQGIEIHAQMIESILGDSVLRRPPKIDAIELVLVLVCGLLVIFLFPYGNPALAIGAAAAVALSCLGGEFALFRAAGLLVDGVYPTVSTTAVFGAMLGANLRASQAARRKLALALEREREAKMRLEGELNAARAIQMGLLPHRFPPFPDHPEIELDAFIEPARMIGGDLYDFLLIDQSRLFFAIADVSGKGVPAALVMAMTKEVLRSAVVRHGAALDHAMAEANTKIAAASNDLPEGADMMFVTVFAGILDLATGECRYASAGHDSPFVLRDGAAPVQLAAEGGPPLGAVDEFDYPINSHRMRQGDALFLFTDGVTEAQDAARTLYTLTRLHIALSDAPLTPARAAIEHVRADLARFVLAAEQADDMTILVLRWLG